MITQTHTHTHTHKQMYSLIRIKALGVDVEKKEVKNPTNVQTCIWV